LKRSKKLKFAAKVQFLILFYDHSGSWVPEFTPKKQPPGMAAVFLVL